jgi:hypothetical protein
MATVTTSEFVKTREYVASFSMIEHKGIVTRLVEEASLAVKDFTRDPSGFIREIFSDESKDLQRSKRIRLGLAFGLAFQIVVITAIAIAGWQHATAITKTDEIPDRVNIWVPPPTENHKESSTNGDSPSNTSAPPKGKKDAGSNTGGGGQNNPLPAQQGVKPMSLPNPAVISPTAPSSQNPALPMNYNIQGIESPPPPPNTPIGVQNGAPNTNSGGQGTGGGIGDKGNGSGVGDNTGTGGGNTPNGGGKDGGNRISPAGSPAGITPRGPIDFRKLREIPGSTNIRWIRRATPRMTPEALANKSSGEVWLQATFRADGTITDIDVIREVPYMTESAIEALQRSKFHPATIYGEVITVTKVLVRINVLRY